MQAVKYNLGMCGYYETRRVKIMMKRDLVHGLWGRTRDDHDQLNLDDERFSILTTSQGQRNRFGWSCFGWTNILRTCSNSKATTSHYPCLMRGS